MSEPLVSIIVRSMDRPTLAETVASVFAQTYRPLELVLVNAGGSKHSLVPGNDDVGIRFVDHGKPLQRSVAANAGLDAATGEFLKFLDDDDRLLPGHVERLVATLSSENSAQVPLAYSGVRCVDDSGGAIGREYRVPFDRLRLFAGNFIPIHAALFRREVLDRGCRVDESLDVYEDWDFWLQVMTLGDFIFVDELSAEYRIAGSSGFGVNFGEQAQQIARQVMRKWLPRWRQDDLLAALDAVLERDRTALQLTSAMAQLENADRQLKDADRQLKDADRQLRDADRQLKDADCQLKDGASRCQAAEGRLDALNHELLITRQRLSEEQACRAFSDSQLLECSQRFKAIEHALTEQTRQKESMENSMTWRLTEPLRRLGRVIQRGE